MAKATSKTGKSTGSGVKKKATGATKGANKKAPARKASTKAGGLEAKSSAVEEAAMAARNSTDSFLVRKEDAERGWWIVDATGQKVGRLATAVATLIRGKHKPTFTPHVDHGDFVVVINTDKIVLSGNKTLVKKYYRHSRFFGSLKAKTAEQYMKEDSTFIVKEAVEGMLPNNKMANGLILKLKAYKGAEHPHSAQKPQVYQMTTRKG